MSDGAMAAHTDFDGLQRRALIVGVVGLALTVVGMFLGSEQFFRSYLVGYLFWVSLGIGSLALTVLHQMTGGTWGLLIRRILEAGARTLPVMGLLFLPIAFGLPALYEWTHADVVAADPLLQHKQPYLNIPFFLIRTVFYFVVWTGIAYRISSWAAEYDRTRDPAMEPRLRTAGGISMLLLFLTITFASYDWIMTLEPHWFSSIFGAAVAAGMALITFAFSVIVVTRLARYSPMAEVFSPAVLADVGSLMLAFTLIWAYLNFSQFIIIYAANLPEEVTWYLRRSTGGWQWVAYALMGLHFALPFVLLMSNNNRRNPRRLTQVAAFIMVMNFVYLLWLVKPAFTHGNVGHFSIHWMDLTALVGLGGIWIALFLWQLKKRPLLSTMAVPLLQERAHAH